MSHTKYRTPSYYAGPTEPTTFAGADSYQQAYRQAERRVRAKQEFYGHLTTYILVNVLLVGIYLLTTPGGYPWFIWPAFGWGIGVASHFLSTLSIGRGRDQHYLVEQEMRRLGYQPQNVGPTGNPWPSVTSESRPPYEG